MSLVTVDSYRRLCDGCYIKGKVIPDGEVIHCEAEDLKSFFEQIINLPERRVILVTSGSDYSVCYQSENPINADLVKHANSINWNAVSVAQEYIQVGLFAANYEKCNIKDKFSVKIDKHTTCTFNSIPKNVTRWFLANNDINEMGVDFIPYGVNVDTEGNGLLKYRKEIKDKTRLLYANFRLNTLARSFLSDELARQAFCAIENDWLTFVDSNIPVTQFYEETANHIFSVVPPGNGLDSFRLYESILVGTIPILEHSRFAKHISSLGLPCIIMENLLQINEKTIKGLKEKVTNIWDGWDNKVLTAEFWKEKINRARGLLIKS